jgi:lipocalin
LSSKYENCLIQKKKWCCRYQVAAANKIKVYNYLTADKVNGEVHSTNICGTVEDTSEPAELKVAPCFLPTLLGGPYWIIYFDQESGLGLVSGGQPTNETPTGCRTGTGVNGSGLWIALRTAARDEKLITKGRSILQGMGYDITILKDVEHAGCTYKP